MVDNLVEKVAEAIFEQEQCGVFPPKMSNLALYGREDVSWKFINSPEIANVCSGTYRKKANAALAAIPSLSFDEAVEQVFKSIYNKLEDDHLPKEFNDGVIKEVAKIALRALTANGDVLIRGESTSESLAQSAREQVE